MRVLIIAHGHPALRAGGAERAAYSLFEELKRAPGVDPVFAATVPPSAIGHDGTFGAFRGRHDEIIMALPPADGFRFSSVDYQQLEMRFGDLLALADPDIVHFHHYVSVGIEAFEIVKRLSNAALFLTIHEYLPICFHNGQMVKTQKNALCYKDSPAECSACFPERSSGKFFLRKVFIQRHFSLVDRFFSPSHFLRERMVSWGIEPERIVTAENLLPQHVTDAGHDPVAEPTTASGGRRLRLGYFGQLNPYKGADILLKALAALEDDVAEKVELVIFGAQLEEQKAEFRELLEDLIENSPVRTAFMGSYRNEEVTSLMRGVDFVVVPSIWWENSPLVIQEALAAGTPLIVSNIGGMKEKVIDGETGFHFEARSPYHLAEVISRIARSRWRRIPPLDVEAQNAAVLKAHLDAYREARLPAARRQEA